jgi:hypothetical protein
MAGDDPVRIQALERMPTLDYFLLIDKRISDIRKQEKRSKK